MHARFGILGRETAAGHRALLGVTLRIAAIGFLAAMYALVKLSAARGVPVFEVIFFRNAFAFVPLGLYIWRTTGWEAVKTRRPFGHLARSTVGLVGMVSGFSAVRYLPLTEATALQFTAPLMMTALSALVLAEPVGRHRWAAVIVGFLGVLIMIRPAPGHMNLPGVGFALASALGAAGANIAIRQIADTERGATIVFYFTLAGMTLGLVGSAAGGWTVPDTSTLGILVLMGLVGGLGQILLTEALRCAPVGVVAPFDYTQLVWAALFGFLIWGELPHAATLAGAAVVVASGIYILHREFRGAAVAAPASTE